MQKEVIIAGFGGQGVLFAGQLLSYTALDEGKEVPWFPSYGPEMRGGTANCTVVLSDHPIGSPIVDAPQALVAMNLPSLDRFEGRVAKDGLIVYNSSLISRALKRSDVRGIPVPANDIARQLGSPRTINMVALGALLRALGAVPLEAAEEAMAHELRARGRERLIEVNQRALARGFSEAGKYLGDR